MGWLVDQAYADAAKERLNEEWRALPIEARIWLRARQIVLLAVMMAPAAFVLWYRFG